MMRRSEYIKGPIIAVVVSTFLVGCDGPLPDPIIDRAGVDEVQYNRDLAACHIGRPVITAGSYVANCVTRKGYKVLYGNY